MRERAHAYTRVSLDTHERRETLTRVAGVHAPPPTHLPFRIRARGPRFQRARYSSLGLQREGGAVRSRQEPVARNLLHLQHTDDEDGGAAPPPDGLSLTDGIRTQSRAYIINNAFSSMPTDTGAAGGEPFVPMRRV